MKTVEHHQTSRCLYLFTFNIGCVRGVAIGRAFRALAMETADIRKLRVGL